MHNKSVYESKRPVSVLLTHLHILCTRLNILLRYVALVVI